MDNLIIFTNNSITLVLLTLMGISAFLVIKLRSLMSVILVSGIFTLLAAGVYITMDAVDVAFTEAAVGAGISTVLGLGTLAVLKFTPQTAANPDHFKDSLPAFIVCLLVGAFLFYSTLDMPQYGHPNNPIHTHVANYYLGVSYQEFGIPNIVTAVLGGYRALDTLGETVVVFTAAIGVSALIGATKRKTKHVDYTPEVILDDDYDLDEFIEDHEELERILNRIKKESLRIGGKK
ncbi:MAG: DUF4040 domain-containing protein [Alphaproteobacteria bacterium]